MKVKDCMSKEVVTVKRATSLSQLIQTFQKYSFYTLPVVEQDSRLVGVVDFEDILKVLQPYNVEITSMLKTIPFLEMESKEEDFLDVDISSEMGILVVVDDIMTTSFVTVEPDVDVNKARSLMKLHNILRLPVTGPSLP